MAMSQDYEIDIDEEQQMDDSQDQLAQGEYGLEEEEDDDGEELTEEQVVQRILDLGNEALANLGVQELIDDVNVFFTDAFYIQFFAAAFPNIDFGSLEQGTTDEEMADNIQALIELLSTQILKFDLDHIRGADIVDGSAGQCMNLLQLVKEISVTVARNNPELEDDSDEMGEVQDSQDPDEEAEQMQNWQQRRGDLEDQSENQELVDDQEVEDYEEDDQYEDNDGENDEDDMQQDSDEQVPITIEDKDNLQQSDNSGDAQEFLNDPNIINEMLDDDLDIDGVPASETNESNINAQGSGRRANNKMQMMAGQSQEELEDSQEELEDDENDYEDDQQEMGDQIDFQGEGEGEGEDEEDMILEPNLIAAAEQMGVDLDPAQLKLLRQYLADHGDEGEGDIEDDDQEDSGMEQPDQEHTEDDMDEMTEEQQQIIMQDGQDENEEDDEIELTNNQIQEQAEWPVDESEGQEEDSADENDAQEAEGEDNMVLDLEELSDDQRQMLLAYLQDEQTKNPEQFPFPKEKLEQLLMNKKLQQFLPGQGEDDEEQDESQQDDQGEEYSDPGEMVIDDQQMQQYSQQMAQKEDEDDQENGEDELHIEGGEQNIEEEDVDADQYQDADNYADQPEQYYVGPDGQTEFTQEQIQELYNQQQKMMDGQEIDVQNKDEDDEDEMDEEAAQQAEAYNQQMAAYAQQQQMMEQQAQQQMLLQQQKPKKTKKKANVGSRYAQARKKVTKPQNHANQRQEPDMQQLQQEQLEQLQQLIQNNPEQFASEENIDPNLLQQLLLAQQQMQEGQNMQDHEEMAQQVAGPPGVKQQQQFGLKQQRPPKRPAGPARARPSTAKPLPVRSSVNSYKQFIAQQSQSHARNSTSHRSGPQQQTKKAARPRTARRKRDNSGQKVSSHRFEPMESLSGTKKNSRSKKRTVAPSSSESQLPQYQGQVPQSAAPVLPEEVVSQLTEDQLHQILQQQQAYMKSSVGKPPLAHGQPRRTRSAKRPTQSVMHASEEKIVSGRGSQKLKTASQIYGQVPAQFRSLGSGRRRGGQINQRSSQSSTGSSKRTSQKRRGRKVQPGQAILLNGYYPALEGGNRVPSTQEEADQMAAMAQQQQQQALLMQGADAQIINEVPPEEEEGESQDMVNSRGHNLNSYQLQQDENNLEGHQMSEGGMQLIQEVDENQGLDNSGEVGDIDLTEEQLGQLMQNADQLSIEQQQQLQKLLKNKWKKDVKSQKKNQYSNIYNILTENVAKAKQRLSNLKTSESPGHGHKKKRQEDQDTLERILRQKREYETLLRHSDHETKTKNRAKQNDHVVAHKQVSREQKLKSIRQKRFEDELINQQKSLMYKRNAQQVRLCEKVYKLASDLEKNKLLEEKREFMENQNVKRHEKKKMVDSIETFYKDKINMLKERIETERFERRIAKQAQQEALGRMRYDLNHQKRGELSKYLALLKQEDQKYDMQSSNLAKLEREIVKLYKKN